jgi:chorismate synthase
VTVLRYLTAGESHGRGLCGILEGLPAGLPLEPRHLDAQLARRQLGHGRGARMQIEHDRAELLAGVRHGLTLGSPVAILVWNRDWENWRDVMQVEPTGAPAERVVRIPRPGHADHQGGVKYGHEDLRNVLERASARETAMRVALGSCARRLLEELGVSVASRVVAIGEVEDPTLDDDVTVPDLVARADASPVRCLDAAAGERMVAAIDAAREAGDTLGGLLEVRAAPLPVGLGSHVHWDRRLEADLGRALLSLNAIKGVEVGDGFAAARRRGSQVHDELALVDGVVRRRTNRSGGIDGGITTGAPLVVRAAMKPIATLLSPIGSVDLATGTEALAHVERSDVCAVPAAAVVAESIVALVLADHVLRLLGGDTLATLRSRWPG